MQLIPRRLNPLIPKEMNCANKFDIRLPGSITFNYTMKLRSGIEYPIKRCIYEVYIDFDHASLLWRENKTYIGNGSFKYKI